jgi:hypothetical protein
MILQDWLEADQFLIKFSNRFTGNKASFPGGARPTEYESAVHSGTPQNRGN